MNASTTDRPRPRWPASNWMSANGTTVLTMGLTAALVLGTVSIWVSPARADNLRLAGATATAAQTSADPAALLRETTDQLLAGIAHERGRLHDPAVRRSLVREHVSDHIDFNRVGMRVLGPHWRRATDIQRHRFVHELERMVYRAFADLILTEEEVSIKFKPARGKPGSGRASVRSTLHAKARKPLDIRFRLLNAPSGWKLYDVVVEGVSLVTTYRAAFSITVKKQGLDGLIESLVAKNQVLDERDQS